MKEESDFEQGEVGWSAARAGWGHIVAGLRRVRRGAVMVLEAFVTECVRVAVERISTIAVLIVAQLSRKVSARFGMSW